jgi:3-deoxy-7-phosphoheptulonate synthase
MIIVMEENATEEQIVRVVDRLVNLGFDIHRSTGTRYTILGAVGSRLADTQSLELLEGVNRVVRVSSPYKLAARAFNPEGTRIRIKDVTIGGERIVVMAGPGFVESREQIEIVARALARHGVRLLYGGAFRSSGDPFGFQGLGEEGLKLLRDVADSHQLLTVSEITDAAQINLFIKYTDIIQVGARNMQNFALLKDLSKIDKPVILTRGVSSTIEETLMSADYLMSGGNHQVIICESGIRTFETYLSRTLDVSAIPVLQKLSHLPVIADPCRGTGRRDKAPPLARAVVAAGADGVLIEVHHDPERALCDSAQSLTLDQFQGLAGQLRLTAAAVERSL